MTTPAGRIDWPRLRQITRAGVKHELGFMERVLALRELPDIEQVVNRLAEEIKTSTQPRRIRVGSDG